MIIGVGTDLVGVPRFERALRRTPGLLPRVFTEAERMTPAGKPRRADSLAARFAAKEAAAKALGAPRGWNFRDTEVVSGADGRPTLQVTGLLAQAARQRGVTGWHVSLTHDADLAAAIVLAESWPAGAP
ncbi:MAG: holo-ACP synthase [Pseudonocardiaceae bacterium]